MKTDARLREAIAEAMRKRDLCEARYQGLVRALVSDTSILWYARDVDAQREFEAAFDEGMALKGQGLSGR